MNKYITLLLSLVFLFPVSVDAAGLVRSTDSPTVYYMSDSGTRHVFPTRSTYESWYGASFDMVTTVPKEQLLAAPLGKNITMRPGIALVTTPTSPDVYAVEQGGVLRLITSEAVAEAIYGNDWNTLVVEIPEVFFTNYVVGEDVSSAFPIPNNLVYYVADTDTYYYKHNDILQPFASEDDVFANGFLPRHIVSGRLNYLTRETPIRGKASWLHDLTAEPVVSTADCRNDNLKAAFIYLSNTDNQSVYTANIATLQQLKSQFAERYDWATQGFSTIDMSYPLVVADATEYTTLLRKDGLLAVKNELINIFYDAHPDEFDFIFVWTDFAVPQVVDGEIAHFTGVTNHLRGIGRNVFDSSARFGSYGRLKGVVSMGPVTKYSLETTDQADHVYNIMLHEIAHQWGAYLAFDDNGTRSTELLDENEYHWSYYLEEVSPLGGAGWINEGNGRFRSKVSTYSRPNMRAFSQLDLYTMGHIPHQLMSTPIRYVVPDVAGTEGVVILGTLAEVSIDDILAANGEIRCDIR